MMLSVVNESLRNERDRLHREIETLQSLVLWVRDGIQHFNSDEDEGQRVHLTSKIDRVLEQITAARPSMLDVKKPLG